MWCNRYGQSCKRLAGQPDREISPLSDLPPLVGAWRLAAEQSG
jgi:hypothetical protein